MGMLRQLGLVFVAIFVFFAVITALSRLLVMKELPSYITNAVNGVGNLYNGAFGGATSLPANNRAGQNDRRRD